jgi:hypothetical protein
MRYGLSGAGLAAYGDTLLVTGGVGRGGVLKVYADKQRLLVFKNASWMECEYVLF